MDTEKIVSQIVEIAVQYGPRLLGAIVVLIIGFWVIKMITRGFSRFMENRKMDDSLRPFLKSIFSILLKILLLISVLGMVGVEMTSFIAILAAAGLAIGMALSGTLQNFAGGVIILLFKPFKSGDFIEAQGYMGTVKEILIFTTILKTPDNKTIVIPNGGLSNAALVNFSTEEKRRVDWVFGIAYGDDVNKAKQIILDICEAEEKILKDPEVFIVLSELADSSVNLTVRAWVMATDYWDILFAVNESVYHAFNDNGINIPFPQMDVHLQQ
ncbi:MAG: mechanosensitive ion channel [Bacteroidales bacterium]|nr:mechanosensitive ion channel [Bacteroidales bacterium]